MVTLIKMFYLKFECRVIVDNHLSESFTVKSGVRQGCIISPILFLVAVDWVIWQTTAGKPRGIPWTPFTYLQDHDFADDLAVLSTNTTHLQEKTDRLNTFSNQVGLNISTSKTKVMSICSTTNSQIFVNS